MFTKEQLICIGVENLADIVLSLYKNTPGIQQKLDIIVTSYDSDPENIVTIIEDEIASLCFFVDEDDEADSLVNQINQIRVHIMEDVLPKWANHAVKLLLSLLDSHEDDFDQMYVGYDAVINVFEKTCADLGTACKHVRDSVEDIVEIVYDRFIENNYSIYDNIIFHCKDALGDEGLKQLKQKLEQSFNQQNAMIIRRGLQHIADCQNNVESYIQACSFTGKLSSHDHLEIARRLIKHSRGKEAIEWLDLIESPVTYWHGDKRALKIQALDLCGEFAAAQAERLKWFDIRLNTKIYNEILEHCEADVIESWKHTAIQKALEFPDSHAALNFLREIKEYAQAAKLVHKKIDTLDGKNYYTLRPIADKLCEIDPLAATLLYRKMIEPHLINCRSKYYYWAAKDLATCLSLSSNITDWQGHKTHYLYFQELSLEHKRKSCFWSQYSSALNTQMAKKAKVYCPSSD